jgi:superfamily II DNA/RNA helicase
MSKEQYNLTKKTDYLNRTMFLDPAGPVTIQRFEEDNEYKIILCTEDANLGTDIQLVDTIINFDTPIYTAQKNLRLGIIDPIRRRSAKFTIINLLSENSIESWAQQESDKNGFNLDKLLSSSDQNPNSGISLETQEMLKKALNDLIEKSQPSQSKNSSIKRPKMNSWQMELDFSDEETDVLLAQTEENQSLEKAPQVGIEEKESIDQKELKKALKSGVEFLSQLVKMSTGNTIDLKGKNIELDTKTGEITLKFKVTDKSK